MDEVDRSELSSAEFENRFFANARLTRLEIELFQQDLNEMRQYLAGGQFANENEGWRFMLATGYAYLRGQREILTPDGAGFDVKGIQKSMKRLVEIESMYAVMKNRTYTWMKDHQTMEMQNSALHRLAGGYRGKLAIVQAENQAIKAEVAALRERLERLAPAQEPEPAASERPAPAARWWRRLLDRAR